MKLLKVSTVVMGLALLGFAGCGSSDTTEGTPDAGGTPDSGPKVYGIYPGANCYRITGISAVNDGCQLNVTERVGKALPGTYDDKTGTLTLGTEGSLGGGVVTFNQGTLVRVKGTMSDPNTLGCSWQQDDTTLVTVTADNALTASVTENQDTIASACGFSSTSCQSTWTWTFVMDGTVTAPACGNEP